MRFAYIDSNGNEVPIPSVDALALRIELGAINENTQLYDAQADQWGPAHTHEIFHTLSRAADEGDGGFVAPLPPLPEPAAKAAPAPEPAASAPAAEEAAPAPKADKGRDRADLGLTLAPEAEDSGEDLPGGDDLGLDLAGEVAGVEGDIAAAPAASFDFGDLEGGLEVASEFGGATDAPAGAAMDFEVGGGFGGGLEQEMAFSSEGLGGMDGSGGLDLEQPMSDFRPEDPPGWMEPGDTGGDSDDVMDFSSISSDSVTTADPGAGTEPRRVPRDRPSPPKFKKQRNLVGPVVGVVALTALGIGGYVLWPVVQARLAGGDDPVVPMVRLPPIPEELMPVMRSTADAAIALAFREARAEIPDGPSRPPQQWLSGAYFANASAYESAETFWASVGDELDAVDDHLDDRTFRDAYERSMAAAGVAEGDRSALLDRAEAGFDAAEDEREAAFRLAHDVVEAALALHAFLVANEDNIEYVPAATVTSDPVLEAKPSTPEIGEAMEDRIDRVTGALDALDYLDLVTADGLWAAILARVQQQAIR